MEVLVSSTCEGEFRGEGESGCEGVRVWGAAHLVRLAPALAVGAKTAAAGMLGLLERRRIRRVRREPAATLGSVVLQHMDPPCALRRQRGALYHHVLPVVLGQELDILRQCHQPVLPASRLGRLGGRRCRRWRRRPLLGKLGQRVAAELLHLLGERADA